MPNKPMRRTWRFPALKAGAFKAAPAVGVIRKKDQRY